MSDRSVICRNMGCAAVAAFLAAAACGCSGSVSRQDSRDRADASVKEAISLEKQGKVDLAVQQYLQAVESQPQNAVAHLNMAILLDDQKKSYLKALYHYQRYLELRPDTEKRELIENRMRIAGQLLGARLSAKDPKLAKRIDDLEKENVRLSDLVREMSQNESKRSLLTDSRNRTAPGVDKAADIGNDAGPRQADVRQRTYTVQSGDNLSIIAAKMYKDSSKWTKIYEANRKLFGDTYNLRIGQVLVIP